MSRANFDITILDHRDPITGALKCRACGNPIPKGRKKYYCSDKCRDQVYYNFGWGATRYQVWKRDGGKCVVCGRPVRYYDLDHDQSFLRVKYPEGTEQQDYDCHHVIPVEFLDTLVFNLSREWFPKWLIEDRRWQTRFNRLWIIVYTDLNNLVSLCSRCHNRVHATDYYFDESMSDAENIKIRDLWANAKINPWRTKTTLDILQPDNHTQNTLLGYFVEGDREKA